MRSNRGAALLIALTVLAVLTVLASALIGATLRSSSRRRSGADRMHILNRAESGIVIAIEKLEADGNWGGGKAVAVPGGACDIEVRPDPEAGYEVVSITAPAGSEKWLMILRVGLRKIGDEELQVVSWSESWR